MKRKSIVLISLLLIIAMISMGPVVASEEINNVYNCNTLAIDDDAICTFDEMVPTIEASDINKDAQEMQNEETISSDKLGLSDLGDNKLGNTIIVNGPEMQMGDSSIQNAIDNANSGDTILITGKKFGHCHFVVNKKLTIISNISTTMTTCPSNSDYSNAYGIFYLTPEASGTIIQGFTLINDVEKDGDDYAIYINGANDVQIINCTLNANIGDAIRIVDAKNTKISNSVIKNSNIGINIANSNKTTIINNTISNNAVTGVFVGEGNNDTSIRDNNITYNKRSGINMSSASYVYVLNNFIGYNNAGNAESAGIYINCNLTRVEILGNYIRENGDFGILNDYRARNLIPSSKGKLELIEDNVFMGHTFRLIYKAKFERGTGDYNYDEANDIYTYVGEGNGNYYRTPDTLYFGYNFYDNSESFCPSIYYNYLDYQNRKLWTADDSYRLVLGEIKQTKKGTYTISIVTKNGTVASNLSSIYVTFYLNKNNTSVEPQEGDIYRTVLMKNGVATATFEYYEFLKSGNVVTAVIESLSNTIGNPLYYKTFDVVDSQIPQKSVGTQIIVSNLNTYPNSGAYVTATLKDSKGYALANKKLVFALNGKTYTKTTDSKGQAKIQINLATAKTYTLKVSFAGYEEYVKSSASSSITVKKIAQKIISSNKAFAPKSGDYYIMTLKDSSNKAIVGKKVTVKIGTKKYTKTTDKKGQIKIKISFAKKKTYKVTIKSAATSKYSAKTKTNKITVKVLKQKITAKNKVYAPNSVNYYSITVKDQNNRALAYKKVTIKVGTKTYKKKTNKNGVVKLKIKLSKKKTYKVTIKSPKTSQYYAKTKMSKITITALKQKITSADKKYLPQAGVYYRIALKDQNKQVIKGKKVKFTINGKTYDAKTNQKGVAQFKIDIDKEGNYTLKITSPKTNQYRAISKTNKITIEKGIPSLTSYDRTFANGTNNEYSIYLKDYAGKALANGKISYTLNSNTYSATTDSNGIAKININLNEAKDYPLTIKFLGNTKNKAIAKTNTITIREGENIAFVDKSLPNSEIQKIIDSSIAGNTVEFLGDVYNNINLNINKGLNIISNVGTVLNGNANSPVLKVNSDNVNISNLKIIANSKTGESDGILINNANNINIVNNTISNTLDSSKMSGYNNGSTSLPGYGISIKNSTNLNISNNKVTYFESALYNEYSKDLSIKGNEFRLSNYGIKYGFESANTEIINNTIIDNIGWYVMNVPEGPCGYGIYLNNSAVNITINQNNISNNYIGISLDANYSTGILITSNLIADNALEGIRFNAGYDLAEDAVEPNITDNAIYRNAKGPSMMILGEMSANPYGIYGISYDEEAGVLIDESLQLHIGPNWYGVNSLTVWNNGSGNTGIGTMCPRIRTTEICFKTVETESPGTYKINFIYNETGEVATNLATFDLYATLNKGTENQTEIHFYVINGTGTFSFDKENYLESDNKIAISVGSLINIVDRLYSVVYTYDVPESEIPV